MGSFLRGFHPLRPGRIHMRCPTCGRKQSNMDRAPLDPPKAALLEVLCDKCGDGAKDDFGGYYSVTGRTICSYCGRIRCEHAEGDWECTEALVNAEVARRQRIAEKQAR